VALHAVIGADAPLVFVAFRAMEAALDASTVLLPGVGPLTAAVLASMAPSRNGPLSHPWLVPPLAFAAYLAMAAWPMRRAGWPAPRGRSPASRRPATMHA